MSNSGIAPSWEDALSFCGRSLRAGLTADRFGFLNRFSPFYRDESIHPLPKSDGTANATRLAEILDDSITAAIHASDKDIYLAWSGGVDSTALACAFLKNGINRKRLHILMSESSVDEYPDFLRLLQKEGVKTTQLSASSAFSIFSRATREGLLCMGWGADQLFGSVVNNYYPEWFKKSWKDFYRYRGASNTAIAQLEEAFSAYGLPVTNSAQANWWVNFSCKWNTVTAYPCLETDVDEQNILLPFTDGSFQEWAMARFDRVDRYPPDDTPHYKEELKDYIFKFTKDSAYRRGKGKVSSMGKVFETQTSVLPVFGWKDSEGYHRKAYALSVSPDRYGSVLMRMSRECLAPYLKEEYREG